MTDISHITPPGPSAAQLKLIREVQSEQTAALRDTLDATSRLTAVVEAQRLAVSALIATHPDPHRLSQLFAEFVEAIEPLPGHAVDQTFREAAQGWQSLMELAARHADDQAAR